MKIFVDEENIIEEELLDTLKKAGDTCLAHEKVTNPEAEISLTFVSLEEIHNINMEFRGVDSPTDVLSFPQFESPDEMPEEGELVLGDVVICTERAEEQAKEFGHTREREIVYLFVHSMFHLLGYDHMEEDEKTEMRAAEESVMNELGITRS